MECEVDLLCCFVTNRHLDESVFYDQLNYGCQQVEQATRMQICKGVSPTSADHYH